jgi:hypothetical protein
LHKLNNPLVGASVSPCQIRVLKTTKYYKDAANLKNLVSVLKINGMKINIAFACLAMSVVLFACKKERVINHKPSTNVSQFDSCNCQTLVGKGNDAQYIRADINGVPVCFDDIPVFNDTFPNMLKYGFIVRDTGNQYYDNLYMIRNQHNSHWQAAIFLENSYALSKTFPYNLPRPNSEICEIGEFQLNDLENYTSCFNCPENKYNYLGPFFGNALKMTATSFNNNVFEGVFQGVAITGSGKAVNITNGKFRIRLVVYKEDIDVKSGEAKESGDTDRQ